MSFFKNQLESLQVMLLTDLDESVMMDLLAGSSVYTDHVEKQARASAQSIEESDDLSEDEKQQQLEFLSDDMNYAKEAQELAEELAIIGLYKTIEIRISKAAKASNLLGNSKIKELFKTEKLIEHFNLINIDVKSVLHFNEFKELKLLNNCLKHSGYVSQSLADANPSVWSKDQKITDFAIHFRRLLHPNIIFLNNLGSEIRSKL
ncbi:TPA: hypothetical protein ACPVZZ_001874 [Vibrio parahaemolyticus]|nr:hypothetical protein [Vibrio parahaemolyticus]